jgi:hypothetical protein
MRGIVVSCSELAASISSSTSVPPALPTTTHIEETTSMCKNKILQYISSKQFWQKKLTTKPRNYKRLQIFSLAEAAEDAKNCALSSSMHWRQ